jgi:hypothetical protein
MGKRLTVRPTSPGLVVIDPGTGRQVPEEGVELTWSAHIQRRINEGSLVEVITPARTVPAQKKREAIE